MFPLTIPDGNDEPLSEILNIKPHFKATDLAWEIARSQLRERLSAESMACLGLLLDEFGSVPLDTIPHTEMLPKLITQGLVEDCTLAVQRLRMERLFADKQPLPTELPTSHS